MLQAKGKLNLPALGSRVKHSKQQRLTPIISLLQNYRIFHRGNWSYTHGALSGRHQSMPANNPTGRVMVIIIIIITRPTLAYSLQGLGLARGARIQSGSFGVFSMSHFTPAALSSDLTNLGPLMTMKIHLETMKNHGNQPKTIKTMKLP